MEQCDAEMESEIPALGEKQRGTLVVYSSSGLNIIQVFAIKPMVRGQLQGPSLTPDPFNQTS